MKGFRSGLAAILSMGALAGCAGGGGETPSVQPASQAETRPLAVDGVNLPPPGRSVRSLPAQTLEPGACGLFFWGAAAPNDFILFENEDARRAVLIHDERAFLAPAPGEVGALIPGDAFRRLYPLRGEQIVVTLEGVVGARTPAGPRIERALMRARLLDGTEIVRPVVGVRGCRGADGGPAPDGLDPQGRARILPG